MLTGEPTRAEVPSRQHLLADLNYLIFRAGRQSTRVALLCIDLDHFGFVNANLGREAGDGVLQVIGTRLKGATRTGDLVARFDGDTFVVVLEGLTHGADAADIAARMMSTISQAIALAARRLRIYSSIGIAIFPDDAFSANALLRSADIAMHRAKQRGRSRFAFNFPR